jgi:hypothetical protein
MILTVRRKIKDKVVDDLYIEVIIREISKIGEADNPYKQYPSTSYCYWGSSLTNV